MSCFFGAVLAAGALRAVFRVDGLEAGVLFFVPMELSRFLCAGTYRTMMRETRGKGARYQIMIGRTRHCHCKTIGICRSAILVIRHN